MGWTRTNPLGSSWGAGLSPVCHMLAPLLAVHVASRASTGCFHLVAPCQLALCSVSGTSVRLHGVCAPHATCTGHMCWPWGLLWLQSPELSCGMWAGLSTVHGTKDPRCRLHVAPQTSPLQCMQCGVQPVLHIVCGAGAGALGCGPDVWAGPDHMALQVCGLHVWHPCFTWYQKFTLVCGVCI